MSYKVSKKTLNDKFQIYRKSTNTYCTKFWKAFFFSNSVCTSHLWRRAILTMIKNNNFETHKTTWLTLYARYWSTNQNRFLRFCMCKLRSFSKYSEFFFAIMVEWGHRVRPSVKLTPARGSHCVVPKAKGYYLMDLHPL